MKGIMMFEQKFKQYTVFWVLVTLFCLILSGCGEKGKAATEVDAREYASNLGYDSIEYVEDLFYSDCVIFRYYGYRDQAGYTSKIYKIDVIYPALKEGYGEPSVETALYGISWEEIVGTWTYQDSERNFVITIQEVNEDTIKLSYNLEGVECSEGVWGSKICDLKSNGIITTDFSNQDTYATITVDEDGFWTIWVNATNGVSLNGVYLEKTK